MLVYVRPSNEALLRARVPGAQDQGGCPSNLFYRGGSASKESTLLLPFPFLAGKESQVWPSHIWPGVSVDQVEYLSRDDQLG
jgi:hypothetical protein